MFSLQCKVLIVLLLFLSLFVWEFARGQNSVTQGSLTLQLFAPSYITTIKGRNITVRCTTVWTRATGITWMGTDSSLNSHPISLGQGRISQSIARHNFTTMIADLKMSNVMPSDNGNYRCTATKFYLRRGFTLTVQVAVNIVLTKTTLEVSTMQSSPESVTCTAIGLPRPTISWMKDGREVSKTRSSGVHQTDPSESRLFTQEISVSSSLILSKFRLSDAGVYTCVSSNAVTNPPERRNLTVFLLDPVRVVLSTKEITIVKGEGGRVRCTAYGYPTPSVQWLSSPSSMPTSFTQENNNVNESAVTADIQFSNVQITNAGRYACLGRNNDSEAVEFFNVIVLVPVSIVTLTKSAVKVSTSQSLPEIVTCTASGFPRPSISWRKDGQAVSFKASSGVYQKHSTTSALLTREMSASSLILSKVSFTDEGVYDCVANNDATEGEARRSLQVTVVAPPSVNISSRRIEILRGTSDAVRCTSSGIPLPNATWFRNGSPVINSRYVRQDRLMNESTFVNDLLFKKVRNEEAGRYECRAIHRESTSPDVKILIVEILVPASARLSSRSMAIMKGKSGTVRCTAFGVPRSTVTWLRNGSPADNPPFIIQYQTNFNDSVVVADLVFQDVRLEEDGIYQCRVSNRISSSPDVKSLNVEVLGEQTRMAEEWQQYIYNVICGGN